MFRTYAKSTRDGSSAITAVSSQSGQSEWSARVVTEDGQACGLSDHYGGIHLRGLS